MRTYGRFEDLPVWNSAIELAEGCEDFLLAAKDRITWSKRDQLDRCSLSVSNNIAEGFERGTTKDLLAFLYIARGSAGETRPMLAFFERRPALSHFKSQISSLKSLAESCRRQLRGWSDSLRNSEIKGQRHLNDHSKKQWETQKEQEKDLQDWIETQKEFLRHRPKDDHSRRLFEQRHGPIE
jgi:four helix bundle protein